MKTFKAKLKHDRGEILVRVVAENEQDAIRRICADEMCPERAIEKIIEIKQAMKTTQITLKGWVNSTTNKTFALNYKQKRDELLANGYKELRSWELSLRGKNATEKIVIKGWYWRGSWSDPTKEVYAIFYK